MPTQFILYKELILLSAPDDGQIHKLNNLNRRNSFHLKGTMLRSVVLCSLEGVRRCFGGKYSLLPQGRRIYPIKQHTTSLMLGFLFVPCFAYSLTLRMEALRSSETSVNFCYTTRRHIPDDSKPYSHRCENLYYSCPCF
jgi:hypothetical protein